MLRRAKKRSSKTTEEEVTSSVVKVGPHRSKSSKKNKKNLSLPRTPPTLGDIEREDAEEERLAKAIFGGEQIVVRSVLEHSKYSKVTCHVITIIGLVRMMSNN